MDRVATGKDAAPPVETFDTISIGMTGKNQGPVRIEALKVETNAAQK